MIVVGTESGVQVFEREGSKWNHRSTSLDGIAVYSVAADPGVPGRVYAAARENGLYESDDYGETWTHTAPDLNVWSFGVAPTGTVYAGVSPSAIYQRMPDGAWDLVSSLQDQPAYGSWSFPVAPHVPNIRHITFSANDPHTVYSAVEVGGVIVSGDDGATWANHREGLHLDVHCLVSAPGDEDVLYAATGRGFYRSFNAGAVWESAGTGMRSMYLTPLVAHSKQPHTLVTCATQGRPRYWRERASGAEATIYRSRDGGDRWEAIMNGLPETLAGTIDTFVVDPDEPEALYGATADGKVLVSTSFGDEWQVLAEGLPAAFGLAVVA